MPKQTYEITIKLNGETVLFGNIPLNEKDIAKTLRGLTNYIDGKATSLVCVYSS